MEHYHARLDPAYIMEQMKPIVAENEESPDESHNIVGREQREADFVDQFVLKVGKRDEKSIVRIIEDSMTPEYFSSMQTEEFKEKLLGLQTPEDRVELLAKYFTGVRIPPELLKMYQKKSETSWTLRDHGNYLFRRRDFKDALHYYNLALMFAEIETEAFGMACANRSAALIEFGQFEEAIEDIELALKNKYPESKVEKLVERRVRCRELIREKQGEYFGLDSQVRKEVEEEMQKMKHMRYEMLDLKTSNPLIPAAAELMELKSDPVLGRQLVVSQDIAAGTVLMVEQPFMFTLREHCRWHMDHCHHCLKRIWRGIPCGKCVFAIYCNEACRTEATKIHRYECNCLPSLHVMFEGDRRLNAFRIILKIGSKDLLRLFETRDPAYFSPQQPYGTGPGCVYGSNPYQAVFHLNIPSGKPEFMQQAVSAHSALNATSILENETQFFEDIPAECRTEFKKFLASVLLRHTESVHLLPISEVEGLENISLADSYSGHIPPHKLAETMEYLPDSVYGVALYPLVSLMNHSCDPNVTGLNDTTNGTMIIVAHRALKKGEPLLISYVQPFTHTELDARQAQLQLPHNFKCHCIACEMKWPTLPELDQDPTFCCPACSKDFFEYEKASAEFRKCLLTAPNWKCGRCGKAYIEAGLNCRFRVAREISLEALRVLAANRPRKSHDLSLQFLDFLQFNTCPPNIELYATRSLFLLKLLIIFYYVQK